MHETYVLMNLNCLEMVLRVNSLWIHLPGGRSDHFSGPTPGFLHNFVKTKSLDGDRALIFNRSVKGDELMIVHGFGSSWWDDLVATEHFF